MFKVAIFDMDGVIVDTEPLHNKAYHLMFKEVGIEVSSELYESFTGQSTYNICKRLVDHFNLMMMPDQLVRIKRKYFKQLFNSDKDLALIDGVLERIKDYHSNDMMLIVASSASMDNIHRIFKRFDLNQYFTHKFSGADLPRSKPHPAIFEKSAKASGYEKAKCFVIEDSTNGIKAAHDAGIYCFAYKSLHSTGQNYTLADAVISDFSEISFARLKKFLS
jgi:beta-phosphoglucomutase-like phosphatase (HAD superfamily)